MIMCPEMNVTMNVIHSKKHEPFSSSIQIGLEWQNHLFREVLRETV